MTLDIQHRMITDYTRNRETGVYDEEHPYEEFGTEDIYVERQRGMLHLHLSMHSVPVSVDDLAALRDVLNWLYDVAWAPLPVLANDPPGETYCEAA